MQRGFSLVELSIVLVILGLLTGGILAGQSLIRAAELRSVSTEQARYTTAIQTFRDKYFGLPGDLSTATKFWGDRATGAAACADAAVTDGTPGTCNGNGNGIIARPSANPEAYEYYLVWQHLSLAGLIEGTYLGYGNPNLSADNTPRARLPNSVWWIVAHTLYGRPVNSQWMHLSNLSGEAWAAANLKAEEAWNIDTKMDDGQAYYGKVVAWNGYLAATYPTTGCVATGDLYSTAVTTYTLTSNDKNCVLSFLLN